MRNSSSQHVRILEAGCRPRQYEKRPRVFRVFRVVRVPPVLRVFRVFRVFRVPQVPRALWVVLVFRVLRILRVFQNAPSMPSTPSSPSAPSTPNNPISPRVLWLHIGGLKNEWKSIIRWHKNGSKSIRLHSKLFDAHSVAFKIVCQWINWIQWSINWFNYESMNGFLNSYRPALLTQPWKTRTTMKQLWNQYTSMQTDGPNK